MKTRTPSGGSMKLAILIAVLCVTWGAAASSVAQVAGAPRAVVQAVQGDANLVVNRDQGPTKLAAGSMVDAWNSVSTNENGKLLLKWETGILNSIGRSSSMFLASRETDRGPVDAIEMTEGLLRVTGKSGGGAATPYMVVTPAASIEPANYDEPVDFIVEAHVPGTSVVTVVTGKVRLKNLTLTQPSETVLSSCQTAHVDEGKPKLEPMATSSDDLRRLVDETTIPGTIVADLDSCPATSPQQRAAEPRVRPSRRYAESFSYSDYEFEDWESRYWYPYDKIRLLQPGRGVGAMVELPGVGSWIIPVDVFSGWRYDPDIIGNYSRQIILDNLIYSDQYYLADLRLQQDQFSQMAYLAQLSGNRGMLWDAQRQLADLNIQADWATLRLNRLQNKAAGLEQEQQKFAQKLPQGKNLFQAVSNSFNSPNNLKVVQGFRDKIRTDLNVQNQLAGLAGKELTDLRSKIARERDPQKRLALRNELTKINKDVVEGKLPIPARQPQIKQVVERLAKEQDPKKVQNLQKQLRQMTKTDTPRTADILTQDKLTSLKQDLEKFPNAQKRNDLQAQAVQLQQSVEERKQAVLSGEKIDHITAKAAKETDVVKRNELMGQLKELERTPTPADRPAGRLNLLGQRQNLESQLSIEQDTQKRAVLEKALDDQRKKQAELLRQQPERKGQPETVSGHLEDLEKQTERQKLEGQRQTDQKRRQQFQVDQTHRQEQGQTEQLQKQQQQTEQKQLQQQEQQKQQLQRQQGEQQRTEQLQKQQQTEQKQLQQQDQQKEQLQRQQVEKQKTEQLQKQQQQTEQKQLQQQDQQKQQLQRQQVEKQRHQKEQAEQPRRQQQQTEQVQPQQQQQRQQQAPQVQQHREQPQQQQQRQQQAPQVQQHREQPQQQQQQAPRVQQPQAPQQQQQRQQQQPQAPKPQQLKQEVPGQQPR